MSYEYSRVGRSRGFKVNQRRFSVQGLRAKFVYLLRRLRFSYKQALKSLRRNNKKRRLVVVMDYPSSSSINKRSFSRSNSFYSEAIADCLEFIKRSSISVDDKS